MNMANLSIFFRIRNQFNFYFLMSFSNNGRSVSVCALRMCWFAIFLKWIRDSIVFNGLANFSLILFNPLNKIVLFVSGRNCYQRFSGECGNAINIQICVILIAKLLISQWQKSPKRGWGFSGLAIYLRTDCRHQDARLLTAIFRQPTSVCIQAAQRQFPWKPSEKSEDFFTFSAETIVG